MFPQCTAILIALWLLCGMASGLDEPSVLSPQAIAASGDDGKGNAAQNAIDDNADTRWSTGRLGEWIQLDFGAVVRLSAVEIQWETVRQHEFSVEISDTGKGWLPILTDMYSSGVDGAADRKTYIVDTCAETLIGEPIEGRMNHYPHGNHILIPMNEDGNAYGTQRGVYEIDAVTREARLIVTHKALITEFAEYLQEGVNALNGKLIIQHAQWE